MQCLGDAQRRRYNVGSGKNAEQTTSESAVAG